MSIQMRSSSILIQKLEAAFGNDIQIYRGDTLDKIVTNFLFINSIFIKLYYYCYYIKLYVIYYHVQIIID